MKIKVICEEKLSGNEDRLLGETVKTPLLSIYKNSIDKYERKYQCTAPYPGYETWNKLLIIPS